MADDPFGPGKDGMNANEDFVACENETDSEIKDSTVSEKMDYPRDLAAFLKTDMTWEIGSVHPTPQDCFDSQKLLKSGKIEDNAFENIRFVSFPVDEELNTFGIHEVIIGAGDMILSTNIETVDTTPPLITVPEKSVYQRGEPVLYKKGVYCSDNSGETPFFEIDSSEVIPNLKGEYNVYYRAKDSSGNIAEAKSVIVIQDEHIVDEERVRELAGELLLDITTPDMTAFEKAKAIFEWCNTKIKLTADAGKYNYLYGAYDGMYFREGDCYTVYATAEFLLDQCGIDTISVSHKIGDDAVHYWSLVNTGDGWYHFDASRHDSRWKCFMQTGEQVSEYGEKCLNNRDYYSFEQQDVPELAKTVIYSN